MYENQVSVLETHRITQTPAVSLGSVGISASEDVRRLADEGSSPTVGEKPIIVVTIRTSYLGEWEHISARSGMPETLSIKMVSPTKTFVRRKE